MPDNFKLTFVNHDVAENPSLIVGNLVLFLSYAVLMDSEQLWSGT